MRVKNYLVHAYVGKFHFVLWCNVQNVRYSLGSSDYFFTIVHKEYICTKSFISILNVKLLFIVTYRIVTSVSRNHQGVPVIIINITDLALIGNTKASIIISNLVNNNYVLVPPCHVFSSVLFDPLSKGQTSNINLLHFILRL